MSETVTPGGDFFSKHRIEALLDGVFAVVMTLLVLEIKPELEPHPDNAAVVHTLQSLSQPVFTYAFAFLITCVFWLLHHRKFQLLRHTNALHTALTLVFLFFITLLPLSVSLYLHARTSGLAQAVYFGNFTAIAFMLLASWIYAARAGLTDPEAKPAARKTLTTRMVSLALLGTISTAASYTQWPYLVILFVPVVLYLRFHRRRPASS